MTIEDPFIVVSLYSFIRGVNFLIRIYTNPVNSKNLLQPCDCWFCFLARMTARTYGDYLGKPREVKHSLVNAFEPVLWSIGSIWVSSFSYSL